MTGAGVGRWPRCESCGELLRRDSERCKNPVCPAKRDEDENEEPES